jgi:histidine triad (HIT) family protein
MSLYGDYDSQNIFAQILRGDAPCYKIYEDDDVVAFLDLFPQSFGHTLVIPKNAQARNILEIDPGSLAQLTAAVQKLTKILVDELKPDGVQIMQFNGTAGGQTVYHIHMHIVPRWESASIGAHAQGKGDPADLKALQTRLLQRIGSEA